MNPDPRSAEPQSLRSVSRECRSDVLLEAGANQLPSVHSLCRSDTNERHGSASRSIPDGYSRHQVPLAVWTAARMPPTLTRELAFSTSMRSSGRWPIASAAASEIARSASGGTGSSNMSV